MPGFWYGPILISIWTAEGDGSKNEAKACKHFVVKGPACKKILKLTLS